MFKYRTYTKIYNKKRTKIFVLRIIILPLPQHRRTQTELIFLQFTFLTLKDQEFLLQKLQTL